MSPGWYEALNVRRYPIRVPLAGISGDTNDITVTVPVAWDHFWDNLRDTADPGTFVDVRVVGADGTTLTTFEVVTDSTSLADRDMVLEVDDYAFTGANSGSGQHGVLWLYFGWGDNSTPSTLETSVTPASALTGAIDLQAPSAFEAVIFPRLRPEDELPVLYKHPDEEIRIWFDVTDLLGPRPHPHNLRSGRVGVLWWKFDVTDGGSSQAGMYDTADAQIVTVGDGDETRLLISQTVKAGSDDDNVLAELTLILTDGQTRLMFAEVRVRNVVESNQ